MNTHERQAMVTAHFPNMGEMIDNQKSA